MTASRPGPFRQMLDKSEATHRANPLYFRGQHQRVTDAHANAALAQVDDLVGVIAQQRVPTR
jgi:hypothetical protein